jgi:cystathionine beta-lyase
VLIVSDEIHCDLVYEQFKHIPVAGLSHEISMQTITTVAPSKTFNLSGLSTSSVIIENDSLRRKFNAQLDHLHIGGGNIFGNIASEEAYLHGDKYVDELMKYLAVNIEVLEEFALKHLPKIKVIKPESTFLVWLDCSAMELPDEELNRFFLTKAKVGFNPGIMFGPGGEGFMRMNIGCPRATLVKALEQIKDAFATA